VGAVVAKRRRKRQEDRREEATDFLFSTNDYPRPWSEDDDLELAQSRLRPSSSRDIDVLCERLFSADPADTSEPWDEADARSVPRSGVGLARYRPELSTAALPQQAPTAVAQLDRCRPRREQAMSAKRRGSLAQAATQTRRRAGTSLGVKAIAWLVLTPQVSRLRSHASSLATLCLF
jgi:hypothetical protein